MFQKFTDRSRRVVVLAQEEARRFNHGYIGTEHLVLALIAENEGVAAKALNHLGVTLEKARSQVEEIIGHGGQAFSGHIPFTPRAKKVIALSLRESLKLGHNFVGTEHLALGIATEGEGVGVQVLRKLGVHPSRLTAMIMEILCGYETPQTPPGVATDVDLSREELRSKLAVGAPVGGWRGFPPKLYVVGHPVQVRWAVEFPDGTCIVYSPDGHLRYGVYTSLAAVEAQLGHPEPID